MTEEDRREKIFILRIFLITGFLKEKEKRF